MANQVKPGKYQAKIVDHDLYEKDGVISSAMVTFAFMEDGAAREQTWFGSFKGGAAKITLETLERMGFPQITSGEQLAALSRRQEGTEELLPLALNGELEFELVMEAEEYPAGSGKWNTRIKWINEPGRQALKKISNTEAKTKIGGLNLGGAIAELRAKAPQKPAASTEEVPF